MKSKGIWLLVIFSLLTFLDVLVIFKPVKAMAPPPSSHIWLWFSQNKQVATATTAIVTVTWPEGTRTEKVELKTLLKNLR
ncbi:MAG: hypothetical protein WCV58_02455 [Patescibacteria group bacterium]|jgi:hypothetical protein